MQILSQFWLFSSLEHEHYKVIFDREMFQVANYTVSVMLEIVPRMHQAMGQLVEL